MDIALTLELDGCVKKLSWLIISILNYSRSSQVRFGKLVGHYVLKFQKYVLLKRKKRIKGFICNWY